MNFSIVSGTTNEPLAAEIARHLGHSLVPRTLRRFPDGEIDLHLDQSVRGQDVYVIQSTSPPVDEPLAELLFIVDACRLAGAERVTAVVPYLGYARQDRRSRAREPLGARLVGKVLASAGVDRLVAIDLHSAAIEGCFAFPVEHMTAVPALAKLLRPMAARNGVIVSPDLGAVKLAERYARELELPVAVVHKQRLSGSEVKAIGVIGDVAGREPIVVDDMISTGATIEAAVARAARGRGAVADDRGRDAPTARRRCGGAHRRAVVVPARRQRHRAVGGTAGGHRDVAGERRLAAEPGDLLAPLRSNDHRARWPRVNGSLC